MKRYKRGKKNPNVPGKTLNHNSLKVILPFGGVEGWKHIMGAFPTSTIDLGSKDRMSAAQNFPIFQKAPPDFSEPCFRDTLRKHWCNSVTEALIMLSWARAEGIEKCCDQRAPAPRPSVHSTWGTYTRPCAPCLFLGLTFDMLLTSIQR